MSDLAAAKAELTTKGALRVGVNMSNGLLVSGRDAEGGPAGVSPDLGQAIAAALGVEAVMVPFDSPGALADAAASDAWDIGNIGAEPQRAEAIAFTPAYAEIEATYLVAADSGLEDVAAVDAAGRKIAVFGRSAYGLWLERNVAAAELARADDWAGSVSVFNAGGVDALAGLRTRLEAIAATRDGVTVLPGRFMAVQQAVGTPKPNTAAALWLADFVANAKSSGLIAELIEKHEVEGLLVAQ